MKVWRETGLLEKQKWRTPGPPRPGFLHGSDGLRSWRRERRMWTEGKKALMKKVTGRVSSEESSWQARQVHWGKRRQQASV